MTRSAIDNGEGQGASMLKNQECWHGVEFIDFSCDIGECGAGIDVSFEFKGEKEIGLIDTRINACVLMEGYHLLGVLSDFISGELEEEIDSLPVA